jgi:hypothetical protein
VSANPFLPTSRFPVNSNATLIPVSETFIQFFRERNGDVARENLMATFNISEKPEHHWQFPCGETVSAASFILR